MKARMTSELIEWRQPLLFVIIVCMVTCSSALSVAAQGICVAERLSVSTVSGKVVSEFNDGEKPLAKATVRLKRGNNSGPVLARQAVKTDGSFRFDHIRPGRYVMIVSEPGLIDFYLDLQVRGSRAGEEGKEMVVIMGADFTKPCRGSSAELRVQKNSGL